MACWGAACWAADASGKEPADAWTQATSLTRIARKDPARVPDALAAWDALIRASGKDRKQLPRARRGRAGVLRAAGRWKEALAEHDRIVEGRARRRDRARALFDGARLLQRMEQPKAAIPRLARLREDYGDEVRLCAQAALLQGELLVSVGSVRKGERAFRFVVEKCRDEDKQVILAYDQLALLELARGRRKAAQRWLERCRKRYEKRAARDDRKGRFLARQLGAMKAPVAAARSPRAEDGA
ncbi:MAG: hypothetical protein AAGD14_07165 [Planctomycetota bacterium]